MDNFVASFVLLFAVIDPIGTVPVFIAVTSRMTPQQKAIVAIKAVLIAFGVLLFFAVAGEIIFTTINIPLSAFQIAGGIILFLFALTMILGNGKPENEIKQLTDHHRTAAFPLAIPSIASPGAILAAVVLTDNSRYSLVEQLSVIVCIALVLGVTLILLLASNLLYRIMGAAGADITSRVMGMILASLAVTYILNGFSSYFNLQ